uniref:Uncharacterized protein n=1 Tax=Arundo donax TaxID=35708 RepID=A0A0A8ZDN5_ARUDO
MEEAPASSAVPTSCSTKCLNQRTRNVSLHQQQNQSEPNR